MVGSKRPRLTRAETQALTRERLIEAAQQEIARHGAAVSIRDIAKSAGYTQGAFYAHFASKHFLLLELMREHMAREIDALQQLLAAGETEGGVQARVARWLENLNVDRDWSMLSIELQLHANRDRAFARKYDDLVARHRGAMGQLVVRLFEELGRTPPAAPVEIAATLQALATGFALQRRRTARGQPDPSGVLIKLVLQSLIASSSPAGAP